MKQMIEIYSYLFGKRITFLYNYCVHYCKNWGCIIHWLHLWRDVRPPPTTTSVLDMTLNHLIARLQLLRFGRENEGVHTFPKGIYAKVNVIVQVEFKLAYSSSAVHRFNRYTTRTPPTWSGSNWWCPSYRWVK